MSQPPAGVIANADTYRFQALALLVSKNLAGAQTAIAVVSNRLNKLWRCFDVDALRAAGSDETNLRDVRRVCAMAKQVEGLIAGGVRHIHVFTLNDAGMTEDLCRQLGLGANAKAP